MGKIYEQIQEKEILCQEIVIPDSFPAIYIDERDEVYCYHGVIDQDRFLFSSSPYYLKGKSPRQIKDTIRGYFRIKNGQILQEKEYIDEYNSFNNNMKCKEIPAFLHFPSPQDMTYCVYYDQQKNLEDILTEKIFGLSYRDLAELLQQFNDIFRIAQKDYFSRYPKITRSIKKDNECELSNLWIPSEFPYIAFGESSYLYSHVSLYGFYNHIKFITGGNRESPIAKKLIENGLNPEILKKVLAIRDDYISKSIDWNWFIELN